MTHLHRSLGRRAARDNAVMDSVTFRPRPADYPSEVIDIAVNGRDLADIVGEVETPFARAEGAPQIAGSYLGLAREQLDGSPSKHFLGSAQSHLSCGPSETTVLLGCDCGEPGCWPLMARVEATADHVTWSHFEQPYRSTSWRYDDLRFIFDRRQYEAALAEIGG